MANTIRKWKRPTWCRINNRNMEADNGATFFTEKRVSLTSGTNVGPYEILARQGWHGRSVSRVGSARVPLPARDSRLNRDVAVKVSAEKFSERFAREAKIIASLNHPGICTLHDVGPDYVVMELVD